MTARRLARKVVVNSLDELVALDVAVLRVGCGPQCIQIACYTLAENSRVGLTLATGSPQRDQRKSRDAPWIDVCESAACWAMHLRRQRSCKRTAAQNRSVAWQDQIAASGHR